MSRPPLPSERLRPGDPRRVGFENEVSDEHFERSAEAARKVSRLVTMTHPAGARPLRICFCHVRLAPRLPFNLFGFHINGIDDAGEFTDDLAEDEEILYALVANQPVEVQREAMVSFLFDLVGRQGPLADVVAERRALGDLPSLTDAADAAAAEASSDTLRFSVPHAVETLKTQATASGYRLEVRYQPDPLPRHDDVARRIPRLRELYDSEPDVRQAVDRTVAMIGGRPGLLRGGAEQVRGWMQQQTSLMGLRQFMNQTLRDADVCGNGYLQFGSAGLDASARCLRPEDVIVEAEDRFLLRTGHGDRRVARVLHLRGLEQFQSPYGISPWEPLLYVLQRRRMLSAAAAVARAAARASDIPESARRHAEEVQKVAEAVKRDTADRMNLMLWMPRTVLPEVPGSLYFSGQERLQQ